MKRLSSVLILLYLSACGIQPGTTIPPTSVLESQPATQPATTPLPSNTEVPQATATSQFQLDDGDKTVVFDFTAKICEAVWMNSVKSGLPCPGDINEPLDGYAGLLSGIDQGLDLNFPMILVVPASRNAGGIFGRYPKFTVGSNDEFRTTVACRSDSKCNIEFSLAFYDENGKYQEIFPVEHYLQSVEPPINLIQPLGVLSGRTLEFVLVVRAAYQSDPLAAWALWISPRIVR